MPSNVMAMGGNPQQQWQQQQMQQRQQMTQQQQQLWWICNNVRCYQWKRNRSFGKWKGQKQYYQPKTRSLCGVGFLETHAIIICCIHNIDHIGWMHAFDINYTE